MPKVRYCQYTKKKKNKPCLLVQVFSVALEDIENDS